MPAGSPRWSSRAKPSLGPRLYPFPFKLERLTLESVTKYFWAEAPESHAGLFSLALDEAGNWAAPQESKTGVHRVGLLYHAIIKIICDASRIPDSDFHEDSVRFQASWDDWGRSNNYKPEEIPEDIRSLSHALHLQQVKLEAFRAPFMGFLRERLDEFKDDPRRSDVLIRRALSVRRSTLEQFRVRSRPNRCLDHIMSFLSIIDDFKDAKKRNGADHLVADDPRTRLPNENGRVQSMITARSGEMATCSPPLSNAATGSSHSVFAARNGSQAGCVAPSFTRCLGRCTTQSDCRHSRAATVERSV